MANNERTTARHDDQWKIASKTCWKSKNCITYYYDYTSTIHGIRVVPSFFYYRSLALGFILIRVVNETINFPDLLRRIYLSFTQVFSELSAPNTFFYDVIRNNRSAVAPRVLVYVRRIRRTRTITIWRYDKDSVVIYFYRRQSRQWSTKSTFRIHFLNYLKIKSKMFKFGFRK